MKMTHWPHFEAGGIKLYKQMMTARHLENEKKKQANEALLKRGPM